MTDLETGEDGLPVSIVGEWVLDKHERLLKYIDISRSVRANFVGPGRAGASFIDLYCGYGRSRIRSTNTTVEGSAVAAVNKARAGGAPFTHAYVSDADSDAVKATIERLGDGADEIVVPLYGDAAETSAEVARQANQYALHVAFLDPYNLDALPFSVIKNLSGLQRIDIIMHVSLQDLQRNLETYIKNEPSALDRFAPGWRDAIDVSQPQRNIRSQLLAYWLDLIRGLDMSPAGMEKVSGSKNQALYWLVIAARHERAVEFWDKIRTISGQTTLF